MPQLRQLGLLFCGKDLVKLLGRHGSIGHQLSRIVPDRIGSITGIVLGKTAAVHLSEKIGKLSCLSCRLKYIRGKRQRHNGAASQTIRNARGTTVCLYHRSHEG